MKRRDFLALTGAATTGLGLSACAGPDLRVSHHQGPNQAQPFELDELSVADLQTAMSQGRFTAVSLAQKYLERIDAIDRHGPKLNSVIELNPDALTIAAALDQERKAKGPRGPLHGIPILIKDNIE